MALLEVGSGDGMGLGEDENVIRQLGGHASGGVLMTVRVLQSPEGIQNFQFSLFCYNSGKPTVKDISHHYSTSSQPLTSYSYYCKHFFDLEWSGYLK